MPIDRSTKTCGTWRISGGRSTAAFAGSFYFGEYRSQGALRIEDKCQIISAQAIIDQRLFLLQPEFKKPMEKREPTWANEVVRLREAFYQKKADRQQIMKEELQAVINIAQLFGPRWRLPIAANLMALLPRRRGDSAILHAFRAPPFTSSSCSTNQADSYRRREREEVLAFKDNGDSLRYLALSQF